MTALEFIKQQSGKLPKTGGEEVLPIALAVRLMELYAKEKAKEVRHAAAEITLTIPYQRGVNEAHRDIMNLQITDK